MNQGPLTEPKLAQEIHDRQEAAIKWLRSDASATPNLPHWEPNTCEWITTHKVFLEWKTNGHQTPLWIYGIPGKSLRFIDHWYLKR